MDQPGEIAEVSLKYKDMVRSQNASSATVVSLSVRPRSLELSHVEVWENAAHQLLAADLQEILQISDQRRRMGRLRSMLRSAFSVWGLNHLNGFVQSRLSESSTLQALSLMSQSKLGRSPHSMR